MQTKQDKARKEDANMSVRAGNHTAPPALELRCGGLHLTIQRVPTWLVSLVTTAGGVGAAWWAHQ